MGHPIESKVDAMKIDVGLYLPSNWFWMGALAYVDHTIE